MFAFLPETFTLRQATEVMTHLKGKVDPSNFRKYLLPFVEPTGASARTSTRSAALYRRRLAAPEPERELSAGLQRLRRIAREAQILLFDLFLATLSEAPDGEVRLLGRVLTAYARHRDFGVSVSRAPELRITDLGTGRPLIALSWDPRRGALTGTALAEPRELAGVGLPELEPNRSGPHPSRFRVEPGEEGADRLDEALRISRAALVTGGGAGLLSSAVLQAAEPVPAVSAMPAANVISLSAGLSNDTPTTSKVFLLNDCTCFTSSIIWPVLISKTRKRSIRSAVGRSIR